MRTSNLMFIVLFLLIVPVGLIACDLIVSQEPIEVPMVVETQIGQTSCEMCEVQPIRQLVQRKTVRRVVMERPVVETFVQVTRERRVRRKPVRSLVRRLFRR